MFSHIGCAEQERLLQNKTNLLAKRFHRVVADIGPVDSDFPGEGIVEARHQADDGRLAAPRGADEGRDLARLDREAHIFQDQLVWAVPKRDLIKFDFALEAPGAACARQVTHPALGLQNFADPLEPHLGLGDRVGHFGKVTHGLIHHAQVKQENDQCARGELARQDQTRAITEHQAGPGRHDNLDDR